MAPYALFSRFTPWYEIYIYFMLISIAIALISKYIRKAA